MLTLSPTTDTMLSPETLEWLRQTARQGHSYSLAHFDAIARLDALEARVALLEHAEADEPDDEAQTLHSVALKMIDTLASLGVISEIRSTLRRAILEPMEPAAAAAPVATDDELRHCFGQGVQSAFSLNPSAFDGEMGEAAFRAIYDHGRQHGTPPSVVVALQEAQKALGIFALAAQGSSTCYSDACAALNTVRAALQQLGQPAPAAAPEPIEPEAEAQPAEDAAPAEGLVERVASRLEHAVDADQELEWLTLESAARGAIREVAAWFDCRGQHGLSLWLREQCLTARRARPMAEPLSPAAQPAQPIQALDPNRLWVAMHQAQERELADNPMADHAEVYSAMIRAVADWLDDDKDADIWSPSGAAGRLRVEADR